jgi:hypothetical protein
MRRKCCAKVLMLRSPYAAAESCTATIRRATRFRALPDFQFLSMSLLVCSYFAPSSLISFFISTTNKGTGRGQCFPKAGLPQWRSNRSTGILPVGRSGVSPGLSLFPAGSPQRVRRLATRGFFQKNPDLGFHFCFCVSYPFYPRNPRSRPKTTGLACERGARR